MLKPVAKQDERRNIPMSAPADMLWWLNHEYGQRLAKVSSTLELLENLLIERSHTVDSASLLRALQESRGYLQSLREEFRGWRYQYFYDAPDSKRMVQNSHAVELAIDHFRGMRSRHLEYLIALGGYFGGLPRPATTVTLVPTGDLWDLFNDSLTALIDFDRDGVSSG